jgi:hypothetical protein
VLDIFQGEEQIAKDAAEKFLESLAIIMAEYRKDDKLEKLRRGGLFRPPEAIKYRTVYCLKTWAPVFCVGMRYVLKSKERVTKVDELINEFRKWMGVQT